MVVVLGANGQLGKILGEVLDGGIKSFGREELDVTKTSDLNEKLKDLKSGDFIINASAYTNVDGAESDKASAFAINRDAINNLLKLSQNKKLKFIHISTDYVFDGESNLPINELEKKKPLGIYGESKSLGEDELLNSDFKNYVIIRTSWLYSEYNKNFLKTMISLRKKEELKVVWDQIGTPTYARDLAKAIKNTIENFDSVSGEVFHFSNEGVASWYDFACEIFDLTNSKVKVVPIRSEEYPTPAKRPKYSVLDKSKIKKALNIEIPHWKEGLKECLKKLSY